MAIIKRRRKKGVVYQVKIQNSDGSWFTESFPTKREAEKRDQDLKDQKNGGGFLSNEARKITFADYFLLWDEDTRGVSASDGWRASQLQMYRDYIEPVIGLAKMSAITPAMISKVLQNAKAKGRSPSTLMHIYNTLHKVFGDAIRLHRILLTNPVDPSLKPVLIETEATFLEIEEARRLLDHVRNQEYELAVWLGIYVGMRIGEIQGLQWDSVDINTGSILVKRTYVRREKRFQEYPKGKKWHPVVTPVELLELLRQAKASSVSPFVVTSPRREFLSYDGYLKALKRYAKAVGITKNVATHALRHSTSGIWMDAGATEADMQALFAHSSNKVTERYIHFKTEKRLGKFANVIRLFPVGRDMPESDSLSSPNLPQNGLEEVDNG